MKTLAENSEIESLYFFLKQSCQKLQHIHAKGIAHGGIEPLTLCIESPYDIVEGVVDVKYAPPEVAIALAISENYKVEEAIQLWKRDSSAMNWLKRWVPMVAEDYTTNALQKFIGTPIPEQQSDIWSLGISYLSMYDGLFKEDVSFPEKERFFEMLIPMVRLRGRMIPSFPVLTDSSVAPRSARWKLAEPIRRGERNKTRKNLHN
jgi:serine/threonine protein kinase